MAIDGTRCSGGGGAPSGHSMLSISADVIDDEGPACWKRVRDMPLLRRWSVDVEVPTDDEVSGIPGEHLIVQLFR
jgi:hypothetical protein